MQCNYRHPISKGKQVKKETGHSKFTVIYKFANIFLYMTSLMLLARHHRVFSLAHTLDNQKRLFLHLHIPASCALGPLEASALGGNTPSQMIWYSYSMPSLTLSETGLSRYITISSLVNANLYNTYRPPH